MSGSEPSEVDTIKYWQVSPGREERGYWPDFKDSSIIAMGWDRLGDLRRYTKREDIEKALRRHYPADYPADKHPANDINSVWIFSKLIKEGDVILAKKGASREVYGIGKVTRRYHFVQTRETFKHVIDVDWLIGFDEKIEVKTTKEFVQWTAHSLPQSRFGEVRRSILDRFPDLEGRFNQLMDAWMQRTGEDLPYRSEIGVPAAQLHLVHKIAWHPGGYKGGFCGNAQSTACDAFGYVRRHKEEVRCSPTVFHCVDEDSAFADSGWTMRIHPPRIRELHELVEGKSLVFLVAPLTRSKTRHRLVGFYTIDQKTIEDGNVAGLSADRNRSSKFDLEEQKLEYSNTNLKNLFGIQNWTVRRSYDFISSESALNVLTEMYEIHKDKEITDPDVNLAAMKSAIESLRLAGRVGVEKETYAILWSASISLHPGVIEYHQEHIRRVGATYWGVGFPIDTARFSLPINGYLYTTDDRKVTYIARIEDIEAYGSKQMPKDPRLRPPEYEDEVHRTYFRISKLERLPVPIEVHTFQQWNGERVVRPPQNYVLVRDPMGLVQPLDLQSSSIKTELVVDETVLKQVCANLNSGSHLIITGPVGTGKTSLSEDLCRAAKENRFCDGYVLTTASSDWTTFDTIGGYMPTEEGKLRFEQGKFLEAIRENKWLIIDEINRADIDKAFGQLFTVLSGQRVELPFKHPSGRAISIEPTTEDRSYFDNAQAAYKVGRNWRIIATMNVYDMNFLFEMSYAFMRRFALVYLGVPGKFEELVDGWCEEKRISDETGEKLKELTRLTERKMGPAILKDIVEYIERRGDGERELAEAIVAYILPQLEGLEREKIEKTWDQIGKVFNEREIPNGIIRPILREIVGIELEEISE